MSALLAPSCGRAVVFSFVLSCHCAVVLSYFGFFWGCALDFVLLNVGLLSHALAGGRFRRFLTPSYGLSGLD